MIHRANDQIVAIANDLAFAPGHPEGVPSSLQKHSLAALSTCCWRFVVLYIAWRAFDRGGPSGYRGSSRGEFVYPLSVYRRHRLYSCV